MKFTEAARSLGCEEAKIQAVFEVEAAGRFFEANGEAPQRFEPHKFPERYWPQIGFDPDGAAPWRASLNISVGDRRRMFVAACRIDEEGAHSAASWGAPQIMGFNHEDAGYSSAVALAEGFRRSEEAQIDGFVALVKAWGLDSAIRAGDWLRFARGYNGTGQARTYANRIERAYRRHAGEPSAVVLQAGSSGANVRRLQQAITGAGYPVDVDGRFGPETTSAVRAFQRANGLTVDGIVGAKTWEKITTAPPDKQIESRIGMGSKRAKGAAAFAGGTGVAISQASEIAYVAKDVGGALLPDGAAQDLDTQTVVIAILAAALVGVIGYMLWTRWKDAE